MTVSTGQIDFDYDGRTPRLAQEIAIILAPHVGEGKAKDLTKELASRIAILAERRYKDVYEPADPIRCHTCDVETLPKTRLRVAVCLRCAVEGRTPGSSG